MSDSLKPDKKREAASTDDEFPSARYFQVHFEHLHEQQALSVRQLVALSEQVQGLERQLARLRPAHTRKPAGEWPKRQPGASSPLPADNPKARDMN
jgi:hypothetical protein